MIRLQFWCRINYLNISSFQRFNECCDLHNQLYNWTVHRMLMRFNLISMQHGPCLKWMCRKLFEFYLKDFYGICKRRESINTQRCAKKPSQPTKKKQSRLISHERSTGETTKINVWFHLSSKCRLKSLRGHQQSSTVVINRGHQQWSKILDIG